MTSIYQFVIPSESPLIDKTREEVQIWTEYNLSLLALAEDGDILYAPWRHTRFAAGQELALLGRKADVERFAGDYLLQPREGFGQFEDLRSAGSSGFAEIIIPPRSPIAGKTLREIAMRKTCGTEPVMLLSGVREERGDFSETGACLPWQRPVFLSITLDSYP